MAPSLLISLFPSRGSPERLLPFLCWCSTFLQSISQFVLSFFLCSPSCFPCLILGAAHRFLPRRVGALENDAPGPNSGASSPLYQSANLLCLTSWIRRSFFGLESSPPKSRTSTSCSSLSANAPETRSWPQIHHPSAFALLGKTKMRRAYALADMSTILSPPCPQRSPTTFISSSGLPSPCHPFPFLNLTLLFFLLCEYSRRAGLPLEANKAF